jgi:hypothetical protein
MTKQLVWLSSAFLVLSLTYSHSAELTAHIYNCDGLISKISVEVGKEIERFDAVTMGLANQVDDGCALTDLYAQNAPPNLVTVTPRSTLSNDDGARYFDIRAISAGSPVSSIAIEQPLIVGPAILTVLANSPGIDRVAPGKSNVLLQYEQEGAVRLAVASELTVGQVEGLDLDKQHIDDFIESIVEKNFSDESNDPSLNDLYRKAINTGIYAELFSKYHEINPPEGAGWVRVANYVKGSVFVRQVKGGTLFGSAPTGGGAAMVWNSGRDISANDVVASSDLTAIDALSRADGVLFSLDIETMKPRFAKELGQNAGLQILCVGAGGASIVRNGERVFIVDKEGIRPVADTIPVNDQTACVFESQK